jgi:hypothetical protein
MIFLSSSKKWLERTIDGPEYFFPRHSENGTKDRMHVKYSRKKRNSLMGFRFAALN